MKQVVALIKKGPFAAQHWFLGRCAGVALPMVLLMFSGAPHLWVIAAVLALIGLYAEEDVFVRAGQALPIS